MDHWDRELFGVEEPEEPPISTQDELLLAEMDNGYDENASDSEDNMDTLGDMDKERSPSAENRSAKRDNHLWFNVVQITLR